MGSPKQLLIIDGKPVLQHVLDAVVAADVDEVVVVLGAHHEAICEGVALRPDIRVVINTSHEDGQSTSLLAGLEGLGNTTQRAIVLLGDQPRISTPIINAVARSPQGPIVRANYRGQPSHPVALDRSVWALLSDDGDHGARDLIRSRPELAHEVDVDAAVPFDIDTPEDYERATRGQ